MNPNQNLHLHPSAHLIGLSDGRVQISMPDGDNLTFQSKNFPFMEFLQALRKGTGQLDLDGAGAAFADQNNTQDKIIRALTERGMLIATEESRQIDGTLMAIYDFVTRRAISGDVTRPAAGTLKVDVVGRGVIADAARKSLGKIDLLAAADEGRDQDKLTLVCADFDNFSLFEEENRRCVDNGNPFSFIWKSGSRILVGPFVRPRQTACFHCYKERRESNIQFIEEFEAAVTQSESEAGELDDEIGILGGLVEFIVARHITFARNKVTSLVKPGEIYSFHLITGASKNHPVLKLPRCGVCGRGREDALSRAVRDLL